jgi:hypothetical protein
MGSADTPFQRFYTQEGTGGGIRFGVGTTNGGQNGLAYMDVTGDIYWRNKIGASTKLNTGVSAVVYKNGVTTRAGNTASGSQTIAHGLSATPTKIRISAVAKWTGDSTAESIGTYNGTTTSCVFVARDAAAGNPVAGDTATNITLTWILTGAGHANNINIMWEAQV